jgi:hypothetical protein
MFVMDKGLLEYQGIFVAKNKYNINNLLTNITASVLVLLKNQEHKRITEIMSVCSS